LYIFFIIAILQSLFNKITMETINKNSSMHGHDIERMSEALYQFHKSIAELKKRETVLSDHSLNEIKKTEVHALLLAARLDVTICFNKIVSATNKYEGCFFLNIALMKMREIMKSLLDITTKPNNPLYYNPHPESKKEIVRIINKWKKEFDEWIMPKRNHSTAHYHNSFFDYINDGYAEVSPTKNQKCFTQFYIYLDDILTNMQKYNPLNINFIESEIKELVNRCRKSFQQDQCI
jgi:hypothetical protein